MPTTTYQLIPLHALRPSSDPAQRVIDPHAEDIRELALSIASTGLVEPLIVRPAADDAEEFETIAGNRRRTALELLADEDRLAEFGAAGLPDVIPELVDGVPCLVRTSTDPGQYTVVALVENLQRVNLTPLEEAAALRVLRDDHGWSQVAISTAIGRTQGHVSKRLTLLKLIPLALQLLQDGRMTVEVAIDVARLSRSAQGEFVDLVNGREVRPELALRQMRTALAQRADRTKVLRALEAGHWPALAGIQVIDLPDMIRADEFNHGSRWYTSTVIPQHSREQVVRELREAGIVDADICLTVLPEPAWSYATATDLDTHLASWTWVRVRSTVVDELTARRPGQPAPAPTEGLGALIPPRADQTDQAQPDEPVTPTTHVEPPLPLDGLDTATAADLDQPDTALVVTAPTPGDEQWGDDADDDVLDELDDEGLGVPPEQTAAAALIVALRSVAEASDALRRDGHPLVLADLDEGYQTLARALGRLQRADDPYADDAQPTATERLAAHDLALLFPDGLDDSQAAPTSDAPQEDDEAADTTPDEHPDDAGAAPSSARSVGNVAREPIRVDRSSRVSVLRAALRGVGVREVEAEAGVMVALAGARRVWLQAAVDAYNAGLAEADAGA